MRIPKYRAFIKSLKITVPVTAIHFGIKTVEIDMSDNGDWWEYDFGEVELMQWTGLVDRRGVEIWEGDVLKREFEIGNTIYDPNTLGVDGYEVTDSGYFVGAVRYRPSEGFVLGTVRKFNDEGELIEKKSAVKIYPRYAEIIGNQFEHPELLEVAE